MSLSERNQTEQTNKYILKLLAAPTPGDHTAGVRWLAEHFVQAAQLLVLQKQVLDYVLRAEELMADDVDEEQDEALSLLADARTLRKTIDTQVEYITDLYRQGCFS